ncbi:MAG: toprim domain-containing protein [Bacteroidia bacterium]|nr:toprim domain-containing protein [Bacteroidia bacterium]
MRNFKAYGIDLHGKSSGVVKVHCPKCSATRRNKRDKSLRVNIDKGSGYCYHCGFKIYVPDEDEENRKQEQRKKQANRGVPAHFRRPVFDASKLILTPSWESYLVEKRAISQATIQALKFTVQEEKMPQTGRIESCLCFNYFENGVLVNTKFRTLDKKFKMVTGAELIPYNIDAVRETDTVIIVEGEMDVASLHTAGFTNAISVPAGANAGLSYFDRFKVSHFDEKKSIIIAGDMDEAGLLLRQQLLAYFGPERCKVVTFTPGCKDANEHLLRSGVESLRIAIAQAQEVELEGVCTVSDYLGDFRAIFENGIGTGAETGWPNFDKCCTFELGRLAVLTGVPGSGKSEFLDEVVLRLNLRHGWKIAYFSPENSPMAYHLCKLAEKLVGYKFRKGQNFDELLYERVKKFLDKNVTHICPEGDATPDVVLGKCRELAVRKECRIFVLDPLNCFEHTPKRTQTETQYLAWFLNQLTRFARRYRCLVFLVAHPRKMNRDITSGRTHRPEMYDISGSADFFNKTDYGLVVDRDDEAGLVRVYVDKVKFRNLGHCGTVTFSYDLFSGRYLPLEANTKVAPERPKFWVKPVNWLDQFQEVEEGMLCFDERAEVLEKRTPEEDVGYSETPYPPEERELEENDSER